MYRGIRVKMYSLTPIIDMSEDINVPKCMYPMKNIHDNLNPDEVFVLPPELPKVDLTEQNFARDFPEMTEIETRQQNILAQLEQLKQQMQNMRAGLKVCSKPAQGAPKPQMHTIHAAVAEASIDRTNLCDVAIKASPECAPFYLLILQKLWGDALIINVTSYLHSSVSALTNSAKALCTKLQKCSNKQNDLPRLNVTLIWKDVGFDTELVTSSLRIPIRGEVNILRYLIRIGPNTFNYEKSEKPYELDSVLDICYRLAREHSRTERQALIRSLNAKLGKSQWFADRNQMTVADIAVSCTLKQINATRDITVNMSKWLTRFDQQISV